MYEGLKVEAAKDLERGASPFLFTIPEGTPGIVVSGHKSPAFGWLLRVKFEGFSMPTATHEGETEVVYP
jgi:hypothetical protein